MSSNIEAAFIGQSNKGGDVSESMDLVFPGVNKTEEDELDRTGDDMKRVSPRHHGKFSTFGGHEAAQRPQDGGGRGNPEAFLRQADRFGILQGS
jgi:hypothetical protein